jgi:hypothetical protein
MHYPHYIFYGISPRGPPAQVSVRTNYYLRMCSNTVWPCWEKTDILCFQINVVSFTMQTVEV